MRKTALLIFLFISSNFYSQGITKNATGESSILFRGNHLELDIGKTELGFGINNLAKSIGESDYIFIRGVNVNAKNSSGLGKIFSKGDLVPQGEISGFLGLSKSNGMSKTVKHELNTVLKQLSKKKWELISQRKDLISLYVYGLKINYKKYPILQRKILTLIDKKSTDYRDFLIALNDEISNVGGDDAKKEILKKIKKKYEDLTNEMKKELDLYDAKITAVRDKISVDVYKQYSFFLFGGINAIKFKRFVGDNNTNLSDSFKDEYSRGGNIGLGVNIQQGNWTFGLNYSYVKTNNFSLLQDKDYTLTTSTTVANQTLTQQKKVTAYSGTYGEVEVNELNFDVLYSMKLDEEAKNNILFNPYIVAQSHSRKKDLLPNSTNIGCGFYFFKQNGNFLGGLYIELPDVDNNYEKAKPIEDQNLRDPLNRISFGIVTKISIGSILGSF